MHQAPKLRNDIMAPLPRALGPDNPTCEAYRTGAYGPTWWRRPGRGGRKFASPSRGARVNRIGATAPPMALAERSEPSHSCCDGRPCDTRIDLPHHTMGFPLYFSLRVLPRHRRTSSTALQNPPSNPPPASTKIAQNPWHLPSSTAAAGTKSCRVADAATAANSFPESHVAPKRKLNVLPL